MNEPLDDRPDGGRADVSMTLRDYFAAKALAGILSDPASCGEGVPTTDPECQAKVQKQRDEIAFICYRFADAMIAVRKAGA